ncbi:MAG TPA: acetyl-CoA decarbonylase/synthase complex subunit gamma [Spirochaetota bacterium]|nr:acetyl-CoA decarbonylase/synthase complex subunit gamma [Spirochaetota bacterium]
MALTGLQIQKLLPGTNCRECGSNTCLAFAMKLAAKKAELAECPYASDEAKQVLGAASEPPVKTIALGADEKVKTGGETVLYRHEKTFVNPTVIAINIDNTDDAAAIEQTLASIRDYRYERVGETFQVDAVAVTQRGGDAKAFIALAEKARTTTQRPIILRSGDTEALALAAKHLAGSHAVICAADPDTALTLMPAARENGHALAITAPDVDSLVALAAKLRENDFANIIIDFSAVSLAERFQLNSIARRAAIKDSFKPLGSPGIRFIDAGDELAIAVEAVTEIAKYGGIVVLPSFDPAELAALMTLRLNLYTDPQKPIQVEPKVYAIGEPTPDSPVFVTTNFSLTYFVVSGEIENSGTSAWLVVPECDGMSVLTAWAAGKFNAEKIAAFMKEAKVEETIRRRDIVIPGYVSQISGELEEALPGWKILIGPQEAADIESFVKQRL